ncbi:MAG TPA: hypothetical protein VJB59_04995 [Bdellovibrionota bacterium]|nr:hypothetical protein [Bdellovibrionota bacterium]
MTPITAERMSVCDLEVAELIAMRDTFAALKRRMELLEPHLESKEAAIISKIEAGADTSRCRYNLEVKTSNRTFPSWKEEFISRLGKDEANIVALNTPQRVYKKLLVG